MRRVILLLLLCLLPALTSAQTTINLTVQDTGGLTWTGSWRVSLNPPTNFGFNTTYTVTSGGGSTSPQSGTLSGSGTATIVLPANANIAPVGTIWVFTVCPSIGACFSQLVTVVTSSPQTLNITPPPAVVPASGGSSVSPNGTASIPGEPGVTAVPFRT